MASAASPCQISNIKFSTMPLSDEDICKTTKATEGSLSSSNSSVMTYAKHKKEKRDSGIHISPIPVILLDKNDDTKLSKGDTRVRKMATVSLHTDTNSRDGIPDIKEFAASPSSSPHLKRNDPSEYVYPTGYQVFLPNLLCK